MNWDQIEGDWKQVKGKIKEQWGKLTDDHLDVIGGKRDQLVGKIQEEYGHSKERVEADLDRWTVITRARKSSARPSIDRQTYSSFKLFTISLKKEFS